MAWLGEQWRRLRLWLRRDELERELADEMTLHRELRARRLRDEGLSEPDARHAALHRFGNTTLVAEDSRALWGWPWLEALARDVRYAARQLRRSPVFTAVAVLSLALGIGANTAVFSLVDAVLLRPLPFPEPHRLAQLVLRYERGGRSGEQSSHNGRTWEAVREHADFADVVACKPGANGVNLATGAGAEYVRQQRVGAGYFRILGLAPSRGREFTRDEDRPGGPPVVVLSHELWQRRFQGDPAILGSAVSLRGEPHTVIGIMPANTVTTTKADLWTPLRPSLSGEGGGQNYTIVARLRPGVTEAQVNSQAAAIGAPLFRDLRVPADVSVRLAFVPLQHGLSENLRRPLLLLWGAVGVVLLICCVNLAGLLLARGAGRTREIATRRALGGSRADVLRQLLAESLCLAALGGVAGALLGLVCVRTLAREVELTFGVWQQVTLDGRVLAVTAAVALLASLLFGLLPAWQVSRGDLRGALAANGSRGSTGAGHWPRRLLIAGQVALSVVLLVGAGLLLRSLAHLYSAPPGFDGTGVLTASLSLEDARYREVARVRQLFDESLRRLREVPGVEAAAVGLSLPYERALNDTFQRADGPQPDTEPQITNLTYVTPDYFPALRMPLRRGRAFTEADTAAAAPVVVVNEAFVRRYLSEGQPLGRQLRFGTNLCEVVGVVADVQMSSGWGNFGPVAAAPAVYVPVAQVEDKALQLAHTWFSPSWIVRAAAPPDGVRAAMRDAVRAVDPLLPFSGFRTLDDVRHRALAQQRVQATLLGRSPRWRSCSPRSGCTA